MSANKRFEHREIKIVGDVACVPLGGWRGKDQYALVDIRDVPVVEKYQWRLSGSRNTTGKCIGYVITDVYGCGGTHKRIFMHHLLFGKPSVGLVTDHINRNKLDNRRENIRHCTHSDNMFNRTVPKRYNRVAPPIYGRVCSQETREKLRRIGLERWANRTSTR